MSATDKVRTLQGELGKKLGRVAEIEEYHGELRRDFPPVETPRNYDLVLRPAASREGVALTRRDGEAMSP
jgi:hypothetical protein